MRKRQDDNIFLESLTSVENNLAKLYRTNILQPLKGFCRVIEEGGITNAAKKYGVTPGLLTKQIKVIEYQLGVELFNRDKNCRIFPNKAGLKFYKQTSELLGKLEDIVTDFSIQEKNEENRTLRIATDSFLFSKIAAIVNKIKEINPRMILSLEVFKQEEALNRLRKNKLDIFISNLEYGESDTRDLKFTKLADYIPYWVLWKGHPLENKDLLTKRDIINSQLIFDMGDITTESLKAFIKDNKLESCIKVTNITRDDYLTLIKNKVGICPMFNTYLNDVDKQDFVFKSALDLFTISDYGCFTKRNVKPIVKEAIKLLLSLRKQLFCI